MSYEPTTWKDGDLVTSAKLNKLEQGVANAGGGSGIVTATMDVAGTITLDKTWQEVWDNSFTTVQVTEEGINKIMFTLLNVAQGEMGYTVVLGTALLSNALIILIANTADDYPTGTLPSEEDNTPSDGN